MLHTETVEADTLALIKRLMKDQALEDFQLVGGTALSLLLGHRKSIDIDLFNRWAFDAETLAAHLSKEYQVDNIRVIRNGIFCTINDVKTDILTHDHKRIDFVEEMEGIRMESIRDIGAMKLNAIVGSGTRLKDFVDMYFLLERENLQQFTEAYEKKYPNVNRFMAYAALRYHDDIITDVPIGFLGPRVELPDIAKRLNDAVLNPHKVFDLTPLPSQNQSKNQGQSRQKGFGSGYER